MQLFFMFYWPNYRGRWPPLQAQGLVPTVTSANVGPWLASLSQLAHATSHMDDLLLSSTICIDGIKE